VEHCIRKGHVLGLHEYSAYHMAAILDADGTGWHTLRYRKHLKVLASFGLDVARLKIAITESGTDDIQDPARQGPPGKGWRDYDGTAWARQPLSPYGDFAGQMAWYCRELGADPQPVGVVDFGWSARDQASWSSFDLARVPAMQERMIEEMRRLPGTPQPEPPEPEETMLEGIDVSRWQGVMNWSQAAAGGVKYAWIKATQSTDWVDPQWVRNAAGAAGAGVAFGPYHYYINAANPIAQAHHFAEACRGTGFNLPPALDLEDHTTPLDEGAFIQFAAEVERLMGRPVIYTARWFMQGHVDTDVTQLARYPLWQAHYAATTPPPCAPWATWTVWQYTSKGPGRALGAQSDYIDRNRFNGTLAELLALRVPPAPPQPPAEVIDWDGLLAHAEHEQEMRGIHLNPSSALLRAVQDEGLEVVLGETTYPDRGTDRVYVLGESLDLTRKKAFVWDPIAGAVVSKDVT
jgi:GH25 family lysozyme M1 (1,4-beta-N-acetylmuramidase)